MKFFVTGATGFIGAHLCQRLVRDGHRVVALSRSPKKAQRLPVEVEFIQGDLSLFSDPKLELPSCDIVIHLAGVVAGKNEREYARINYEGVVSLVECLERQAWKPQQFLFASSLAAGGPTTPGHPVSEDMEPAPVDAYGSAKLQSERYLKKASFPTTSFRPAIVLGPLDTATLTLYKMARLGLGFRPGGAIQPLSFVNVDDLVEAIVRMSEQPPTSVQHRAYYVSHPDDTDNVELMKEMANAFDKKVRLIPIPRVVLKSLSVAMSAASQRIPFKNQLDEKQYRQITASAFFCTSDKLQRELNWVPKKDLRTSIRESIDGYEREGWL